MNQPIQPPEPDQPDQPHKPGHLISLTLDDLKYIEVAARAATPGPWHVGHSATESAEAAIEYIAQCLRQRADHDLWLAYTGEPEADDTLLVGITGNGPTSKANAEYLATLHPANILNLIACLRGAIQGTAEITPGQSMVVSVTV